ncbi:hypothetical protein [Anaerophilus nitritogenes]|uniref:hypothetical protein n=1 Tax=Anaerophilus nitritogenes TaxID=2498136 RepID=UPI00101B6461|nr:hypothetical protein [Anaerophilus nitritogenes]
MLIELTQYGRYELMIHGGKSQSSLWNTDGYIRVFDRDMKVIVDYINNCHNKSGRVTINEY